MIDDGVLQRFRDTYNLLVVLGPTASGKTRFAVALARNTGGEIISADSRQVYRGMDLGTGKDLSEYGTGGALIPVHLIDVLDPAEEFSVFSFRQRFYDCFQEITKRGRIPTLVGGTGLYLESVIREYRMPEVPEDRQLRHALETEVDMESLRHRLLTVSPEIHNRTDLLDPRRLIRAIEIAEFTRDHPDDTGIRAPIFPLIIGIRCKRDILHRKITARLESRLKAGMVDEVHRLHERGISWKRIDSFGLEYRYIGLYLQGRMPYQTMVGLLNTRIRQYAKRQETWFRRMEKKQIRIHWIDGTDDAAAIALFVRLNI